MDSPSEASRYLGAAVCRRGHVETTVLDGSTGTEVGERCPKCGAEILTGCPACGHRIRGYYLVPGVIGTGDKYTPPQFCDSCGKPFPWLDRQGRIYLLENMLADEDLADAEELVVREQLAALAEPDLSDEEQAKRWERVKNLAPGLWSSGKPIIESVVTAAVKAQLGL